MAVKINRVTQAPAEIRFEQPEGPEVVGSETLPTESTGFHEKNPGDETVEATWHAPDQTGMPVAFEQPGPEVVKVDGWLFPDDDEPAPTGKAAAQAKVIESPKAAAPSSTSGAVGK